MSKDDKRMDDLEFFTNNIKTEHFVIIGKRKRVNEMSRFDMVEDYKLNIKELEKEIDNTLTRYRKGEISAFICVSIENGLKGRIETINNILRMYE